MDVITCLSVIAIIYGVLYFFDTFFKTCAHYPYLQFLKGTGLEIRFFQLRWTTTAFNRLFIRWGTGNSKFISFWFTLGLYVTLLLLPVAVILLLVSVGQSMFVSKKNENSQVLDTIIPGIDFPASEIGYYSITLVICSIFHELGHAVAAIHEDIYLNHIGIMCFFVLPIAYVNINTERLMSLNPWRALKIMCAGVWHNLVLSLIGYLCLSSTPFLMSLFFQYDNGITVTFITKTSPLRGAKGVSEGDIIEKINNCDVTNEDSWLMCLDSFINTKPQLCVHADLIHTLDESTPLKLLPNGVYDCCTEGKTQNLCFEAIDRNDGVLEIPPHICLPARRIVEQSHQFCSEESYCPHQMHCIRPIFDNFTNLFKISRKNKPEVIYIGHASDMLYTLQISPYIPKKMFYTTLVPDIICKFFRYIIIFSLGLGIVNVLPCLFMDGEHITKFLIQILLRNKTSSHTINTVSVTLSLTGAIILILYSVYSFWHKLFG